MNAAGLVLLLPFGALCFAAGAVYAREAIKKNPSQIGLRPLRVRSYR